MRKVILIVMMCFSIFTYAKEASPTYAKEASPTYAKGVNLALNDIYEDRDIIEKEIKFQQQQLERYCGEDKNLWNKTCKRRSDELVDDSNNLILATMLAVIYIKVKILYQDTQE